MNKNDPYNLQRFVEAQERVYERACQELSAGHKQSHWMWFIFPQLKGLGHSGMANHYGISSSAEARAYLAHAVLGPRLVHITQIVVDLQGNSAEEIFGYPDDLKFRSCMTLFARTAAATNIFQRALEKYFNNEPDLLTVELLGGAD
jgi:uncharacterized protein (DUF1810 family)